MSQHSQDEVKFIGPKKVKNTAITEEITPGGIPIVEVEYEDGVKEWFSSKMFEKIIASESCDESTLRDKRVHPVVGEMQVLLREWGIKLGELPYMSIILNQSLDFNQKSALQELWSKWMPKPQSLDDVDLITIDRVLKSINGTDK